MVTLPRSAPAVRRRGGLPVWVAAWPVMAVFVLSNAATPLYPLWRERLGFASGTMTLIFACYIAGLVGALLVAGVLSDRIGRRPVLLPALGLAIAACALFATAGSVAALAVARLLTGIAVGATVSAGMAAVSDVAGADRGRAGALAASSAMVLGAGTGPLLAGLLSQGVPWPTGTVFAVEAVLLVSAAAVVLRLPQAPARRAGAWVRVPGVPRSARARLAAGVAVFAPGLTATSFVLSLGPSVLAGLLGHDHPALSGVLAFAMFAAAAGAQFAVRRLALRTVLLTGALATLAGMAALVLAVRIGDVRALAVAAVLAGAGQGLGQLGGLSLLNAGVPAARLAEANAALNVGAYLPAGLLPVATGFLSDATGLSAGATVFGSGLAALALIGGLVVLATVRRVPA
ncbi:MFS transporter [Bailinhaonella thermotolerans]|uniref:MFS transporter n=1 Tax=Bailinhaonella thermotolerans TaxID=1070861 RepID=A0A3A4AEC5_9ACTN|nr:MFS transporter [Bailinhaonella thermotolerans]RJL25074.1 MFS transporter [Bailinhaonella thermotolerans]